MMTVMSVVAPQGTSTLDDAELERQLNSRGLLTRLLGRVMRILVAVFVATWLIALAVWRLGRIEQRWTADVEERQPASSG